MCALALSWATTAAAEPEPWSDDDGLGVPKRHELDGYGFETGAEYRANWLYVNPVDLNGVKHRRASWIEHRLRLDGAVDYEEKVRIIVSVDALDGTLWGDNGTFGTPPSPNSGTRAAATNPNNAKPAIGYVGGDELDPDSYGYVLVPSDPVKIRRAYGEVSTPVGYASHRSSTVSGRNFAVGCRWRRPAQSLRLLQRWRHLRPHLVRHQALEALKPEAERDRSPTAAWWSRRSTTARLPAEIRRFGDDLQSAGGVVRYLQPDPKHQSNLELQGVYAHRWERDFDTDINIVTARAIARVQKLRVGAEGVAILGRTREVSDALSLINNDPIVRQKVKQFGARAVARWDEPAWTAYLEFDFASGRPQSEPRDRADAGVLRRRRQRRAADVRAHPGLRERSLERRRRRTAQAHRRQDLSGRASGQRGVLHERHRNLSAVRLPPARLACCSAAACSRLGRRPAWWIPRKA